ncbi:MAG TPA: SRPBCC family protein [Pseudonocardiaceae bacterium]|nr:SRPBCC family protein [Pseudonocardiaceae bacterium]
MNDAHPIQVSRIVEAPVERVFALIADPDRHPDLDGTGTLRASRTHTVITEVGDVFIMDVHAHDIGRNQSQSVVTTYVRDRALGWAPGPVDRDPFGHTFTFTLEPNGDDQTLVTLTYDWSAVTDEQLLATMPQVSKEELSRSLDRLAAAL